MNVALPKHLYGFVRAEFLYNMEAHHGEFKPAVVFGLRSVGGKALRFHVVLEDGACFWQLPLHALSHTRTAPARPLWQLQRWDCFGDRVESVIFDYLTSARARVFLPDAAGKLTPEYGTYAYTVDWLENGFSDEPSQQKCAHIIALDDGNYAAQPNNRVQFLDASFVKPFVKPPDYRTNTRDWSTEQQQMRCVTDDGRYFYGEVNGDPKV